MLYVECEAVGMRVSTSKSKAMVFCRRTLDCPLRLGDELLPQMREFKYLRVLFTSDGKQERKMDRWLGAVSVVMQARGGSRMG